ncbi:hypothetical protein pipiens_017501, partial [Culex pipiens pipiens]
MADPKFQFLPYIRLHISTKDSYNKFKGKYLTGDVDFSDRIGKKFRTGYDSRSGEWDLAGEGEKESPIQKCLRLQCEMNELMEEITASQTDASKTKEEKASYEAVFDVVVYFAKAALLQPSQLDVIEGRLGNLVKTMNAIQEKSSANGQDANREQKILELYDIAKTTEPIAQILPEM